MYHMLLTVGYERVVGLHTQELVFTADVLDCVESIHIYIHYYTYYTHKPLLLDIWLGVGIMVVPKVM